MPGGGPGGMPPGGDPGGGPMPPGGGPGGGGPMPGPPADMAVNPEYRPCASQCQISSAVPLSGRQVRLSRISKCSASGRPLLPSVMSWRSKARSR
ncbi:hypothetical protein DVT68_03240 [Dyella solisilvae]|uniref:Uncharacterized protein n=1 Tax=Dyella solisilvae TaxID=1920168 RepID=A0A370KB20_9GAMM|nr:hypothetical protein DVT68_03240 [Dyella solisilvae]